MVTLKGTGVAVLVKRLTVQMPGAPGHEWLTERYGMVPGEVYTVIALHNETYPDHSNTVTAYITGITGKIIKVGLEHLAVVEIE